MVLINSLLYLVLNASPGQARPGSSNTLPRDESIAAINPIPLAKSPGNVKEVVGANSDSMFSRSIAENKGDMVEVPEKSLEDILDEIKDLEGQVEAMMPSDAEAHKGPSGHDEEDECQAEDQSLDDRSEDNVSKAHPRRKAKCTIGSKASPQQMIELSDSSASDESDDDTSRVSTTSIVTSSSTVASLQSSLQSSATAKPVAFNKELKTTILTSTKATELTTTITRTHTKTISLSRVPKPTTSLLPPNDADTAVEDEEANTDIDDAGDHIDVDDTKSVETKAETKNKAQQQQTSTSIVAPPHVDLKQALPNTTATLLPTVKVAPVTSLSSTSAPAPAPAPSSIPVSAPASAPPPAPELPAVEPEASQSMRPEFLRVTSANATTGVLTVTGFKTITTPGMDG